MDAEEAIEVVNKAVRAKNGKYLRRSEEFILLGSFDGKTYDEIAEDSTHTARPYTASYLRQDIGPRLWHLLSDVFEEDINKLGFRSFVERRVRDTPKNSPTQSEGFETDNHFETEVRKLQDWSPPDIPSFLGRDEELEQLEQLIRLQGCRLIMLCGAGKVGKTALAAKLGQSVWDQFDVRIWRSIDPHPPAPQDLISDLIYFFSHQQETSSDISRLLYYLRQHRCLIVLDGLETVMQAGAHDGSYQHGYEGYDDLLRQLGEQQHQSCIILTSREALRMVITISSEYVYYSMMRNLGELSGREFIESKGHFSGSEQDWKLLVRHFEGNPHMLHIAAMIIRDLFDGHISNFLQDYGQDTSVPGDISRVLDEQFARLSALEQLIINCLTERDEPATFQDIFHHVSQFVPRLTFAPLRDALMSLRWRSLTKMRGGRHFLGRLMKRYAFDRLQQEDS